MPECTEEDCSTQALIIWKDGALNGEVVEGIYADDKGDKDAVVRRH
jgi:hypothetical protein